VSPAAIAGVFTTILVALVVWRDRWRLAVPCLAAFGLALTYIGLDLRAWYAEGETFCNGYTGHEVGVALLLALALAALGVVAALTGRDWLLTSRRRLVSQAWSDLALLALMVVAGLGLRFLLGRPTILTDPGTLLGRLASPNVLFGGLQPLLQLLSPVAWHNQVWPLTWLLTTLSALGPAAVFLGGRALGYGRARSALGGLILGCWPIPAVLFNGDFVQGTTLTLAWIAFALLARGARDPAPRLLSAGLLLVAYVIWARIDTLLVAAPAGLIALHGLWRARARPMVWVAGLVLATSGLVRVTTIIACTSSQPYESIGLASLSAMVAYLWEQAPAAAPPFLVLGLLAFTVSSLMRRRSGLIWAGIGIGLIPAGANGAGAFEFLRYSTHALPWLALGAAVGWMDLADGLAGLAGRRGFARASAIPGALACALVIWMAGFMFSQRDYLRQVYTSGAIDAAFREALPLIPPRCGVVVPSLDPRDVLYECQPRLAYDMILDLESPSAPRRRFIGSYDAASLVARGAWPPRGQELARSEAPAPTCWYLFWGWACEATRLWNVEGYDARKTGCRALRDGLRLREVWGQRADMRDHRLATRPEVKDGPLVRQGFRFVLYEIQGLRPPD
jgi:hypothetical protein